MRRIFLFFVTLMLICTRVSADEFVISADKLPEKSLSFIEKYFPDSEIKKVEFEKRASLSQYNVKLSGGNELQFNLRGQCTEVECKKKPVPEGIVPAKIAASIKKEFPDNTIQGIEHDGKLYEVTLDNGWDVTYNSTYRLIDIDKD